MERRGLGFQDGWPVVGNLLPHLIWNDESLEICKKVKAANFIEMDQRTCVTNCRGPGVNLDHGGPIPRIVAGTPPSTSRDVNPGSAARRLA